MLLTFVSGSMSATSSNPFTIIIISIPECSLCATVQMMQQLNGAATNSVRTQSVSVSQAGIVHKSTQRHGQNERQTSP